MFGSKHKDNMKDKFSIFIVGERAGNTVRPLPFPKAIIVLVSVLFVLSLCFTSIILSNISQHLINRIFMIKEEITSARLENEFIFMQKLAAEADKEINDLFSFDDNMRLLYGMSPINKDVREVGVGGPDLPDPGNAYFLEAHSAEIKDLEFGLDKMLRQSDFESGSIMETHKEVVHTFKKLRRFPSVLPVFGQISSGYGYRFHPIEKVFMNHDGIDIANERWTPVYATADGVVSMAEFSTGYGNLIVLEHGYGYTTYYGHLQDYAVRKNQFVIRGDLLGYIGNSGRTTGPHLHYEIRKSNKPKDPLEFIYPVTTLMN